MGSRMNMMTTKRIFREDAEIPFPAPRGDFLSEQKLFVADPAQNGIFIWHTIPVDTYVAPDIVLGQTDTSGTSRNGLGHVSAYTLFYPSGYGRTAINFL